MSSREQPPNTRCTLVAEVANTRKEAIITRLEKRGPRRHWNADRFFLSIDRKFVSATKMRKRMRSVRHSAIASFSEDVCVMIIRMKFDIIVFQQ